MEFHLFKPQCELISASAQEELRTTIEMALFSEGERVECVCDEDGFEELEMEIDEALLRTLLEETDEESGGGDEVKSLDRSMDVDKCDGDSKNGMDKFELEGDMVNVVPVMEVEEAMTWYVDDMVEMIDYVYAGDCSQFYDEDDETNYCYLWQD